MFFKIFLLVLLHNLSHCNANWFDTVTSQRAYYSFDESEWFDQELDHTDPRNVRTWKQKYYKDFIHYVKGGPVILHIGGEGPARAPSSYEFLNVLASELNAAIFVLEHRFYGDSQPTSDTSVEYLEKYYSIGQALKDVAKFIYEMNKIYSLQRSKWLTYGGSYPGALSLYARVKYPELIHGAIGASPAIHHTVEYTGYNEVVMETIYKIGGAKCVQNLVTVFKDFYDKLETQVGRNELQSNINICNTFGESDIQFAKFAVNTELGKVVQYNNIISSETNVGELCTHFEIYTQTTNPSYGLGIFFPYHLPCIYFSYAYNINLRRNTDYSEDRVWEYHVCTEFGNLITVGSPNQPLQGDNIDFYLKNCADMFGKKAYKSLLERATRMLNREYGGLNIVLNITNAVIINSGMDPWVKTSYVPELYTQNENPIGPFVIRSDKIDRQDYIDFKTIKSLNKEIVPKKIIAKYESYGVAPSNLYPDALSTELRHVTKEHLETTRNFYTIYVPSVAHCAIMNAEKFSDDPSLIEARNNLTTIVKSWI